MENLQTRYQKTLQKELQTKLKIKNKMATPALSKIVINMGVKDAVLDKKNIQRATEAMAIITGQKPKIVKSKKSIAAFKLREGDPIGVVVTLRGKRMYSFLEKIINVVLPRLRDFHGVKKTSFDGFGNYSLGLTEYSVFPEIDQMSVERIQGIEMIVVTTAKDNKEGIALMELLGMPFIKEEQK